MARHAVFSEHDSEPLKGLPEALPAGEQVLWQGVPAWRGLALDAYRVRALSVYFAVIVVARCVWLLASGVGNTEPGYALTELVQAAFDVNVLLLYGAAHVREAVLEVLL